MGNIPIPASQQIEFPEHLKSPTAEIALLAAVMADNSSLAQVSGWLKPEHFGDPLHSRLFEAMLAMGKEKKRINPVTLKPIFEQDRGIVENFGDVAAFLVGIAKSVVSTINNPDYGFQIVDCFSRRQTIALAHRLKERATNERFEIVNGSFTMTPEQMTARILADGKAELAGLEQVLAGPGSPERLEDATASVLASIEDAYLNQDAVGGIPTGLIDLDRKIGGLYPGNLIVIAGRPGMGKSAYLLSIMWRAARGGIVCILFSLEMPKEELIGRLLAMETGIPYDRQRTGKISDLELASLREAKRRIDQLPIHIFDDVRLTPGLLDARARAVLKPGVRALIGLDYLQLLQSEANDRRRAGNRTEEVSQFTRELKATARALGAPLLALSQLSRAVENRDDKRPQLSDLRESGSIEQDADQVQMLYREEYYLELTEPQKKMTQSQTDFDGELADWRAQLERCQGTCDIILAKYRAGSKGTVRAAFNANDQRFDDLMRTA